MTRGLVRHAVLTGLLLACSASTHDDVGSGAEQLTAIQYRQPVDHGHTETSITNIVGTLRGVQGSTTVMAANNCDYLWSIDYAQTWQGPFNCNLPGPHAWPQIVPNFPPFLAYEGDNWLAGDGIAQHVLATSIGVGGQNSFGTPTADVGLIWSNTAGDTWQQAALVSDLSACPGNKPCGGGVDGPVLAGVDQFLAGPDNRVWVWWWNSGQVSSTDSYQSTFVRNFPMTSAGIGVGSPIIDLGAALPNQAVADQSLFAVAPAGTLFGGSPQATLVVVFRDKPLPQDFGCPNQNTITVNWTLAYSLDEGIHWQLVPLGSDVDWPECLSDNINSSNRFRGQASFDWGSGEFIFAINRSAFDTNNNYVGQRVVLYQWPSVQGAGMNAADSWVVPCDKFADHIIGGGGVPGMSGVPTFPASEPFCNQYGPSTGWALVTGGGSRAAFTFYSTVDTLTPPTPSKPVTSTTQWQNFQVDFWGATVRTGAPFDAIPHTRGRLSPIQAGMVPWTPNDRFGNAWWGDYQGLTGASTASGNGEFITTWVEDQSVAAENVYTAQFQAP